MDPYLKPDMEKLERIQRNTVSFISGDYFVPTPGSVGNLLISTYISPTTSLFSNVESGNTNSK